MQTTKIRTMVDGAGAYHMFCLELEPHDFAEARALSRPHPDVDLCFRRVEAVGTKPMTLANCLSSITKSEGIVTKIPA